ncbi:MAG: NAD(P)/FAD-dependent oxidoreductase [Solirubrobacterales bacterium]
MPDSRSAIDTDVLVVGAGPGGSAAAYHLARHGVDVTVLDRAAFPREKVCGDGLTPRSVRSLLRMGIDTTDPRFERVEGLRVYSKRTMVEFPWPKLRGFPDYGLVGTRSDLDEMLVRRAEKAGARLLERTEAVAPILEEGWVRGVLARDAEDREGAPFPIRARLVFAADGASSKLSAQAGVKRDDAKPLGIAARRYYRIDHHPGPWFESWLDLWEGDTILPGYGWLFPVADGTVNLGAGLLNTAKGFKDVSAQRLFAAFASMMPPEWGVSEETAVGRVLSGPLPMGGMRRPAAVPGMLLIGDAAGMVNPFNGEGIAYAMESAEVAAELAHESLVRGRPGIAQMYPTVLRERYGRYFWYGTWFARAIGHPRVMQASTRYLLPSGPIMRFALRVLGNLSDRREGDLQDRLFAAIERLAPVS